MQKQRFSKIIYLNLALNLSATSALSQVQQYIDMNYGDQGQTEILTFGEFIYGSTHISIDSLDNIYLSIQYTEDSFSLLKVNAAGEIDTTFQDSELITDSKEPYFQIGNFIYYYQTIESTTLVNVYDLNLNLIQKYRMADLAELQNYKYDSSGHFVGVTENFIFKYLPDGQLDSDWGKEGLINLSDIVGEYNPNLNKYEFQNERGDHYFSFYEVSNTKYYSVVRFDKEGNRKNTLYLPTLYSSFDNIPTLANHKLLSVTPLQNGQMLIEAEGKETNSNNYRYYQVLVNEDLSIDVSFGMHGINIIPIYFHPRYVAGTFSSNEILLRNGHNNSQVFETIAILGQDGNIKNDVFAQEKLNLDFNDEAFSFRLLSNDKSIYILYIDISSAINKVILTKLNLDNILVNKNLTAIAAETQLSPNPTSSLTNLLYTGPTLKNALLHIYSTTGELIREQNIEILTQNQTIEISTTNMSANHYIVVLMHDGQLISADKMAVVR